MTSKRGISRRQFLGFTGAGLATMATRPWMPKKVYASPPAPGTVQRVLVLHLGGGARETAMFHAHVQPPWNPFGYVSPGDLDTTGKPLLPAGVEWGVGLPLVGNKAPIKLTTWPGQTLPLVSQIADKISVIGAVDHDPTAPTADSGHTSATQRMCTGNTNDNGFLAMIYQGLGQTKTLPLPPVVIGGNGPGDASVYAQANGPVAAYRPLVVGSASDFDNGLPGIGMADPSWLTNLESSDDQAFAAARANAYDNGPQAIITSEKLAVQYGTTLANPALRLSDPMQTLGKTMSGTPITNAMLSEIFTTDSQAIGVAVAIRLFQLGCPAVAVAYSGWDFHSGENTGLPPMAAMVGRIFSGLYFVLSQIPDPNVPGLTMFDTTIVTVGSEFNRSEGSTVSGDGLMVGYNRGNGTDHHGDNANRYQALPLMGGGIPGGRMLNPTDDSLNPTAPPVATASMMGAILQALGIDPTQYFTFPAFTAVWG